MICNKRIWVYWVITWPAEFLAKRQPNKVQSKVASDRLSIPASYPLS
jgi:hypothetical protein